MIDEILAEMGLSARSRDGDRVLAQSPRVPCETLLRQTGDELRVEALLADWEQIGAAEESALTMFLRRASRELGYATCEIRDRGALLVVRLAMSEVETSLASIVEGVLSASRALTREAAALLRPELAQVYLSFHGAGSEILMTAERV